MRVRKQRVKDSKAVFITGASSGIGRALALHYAVPRVTLGLVARRSDLLKEVEAECRRQGAETCLYELDVTDRAGMAECALDFTRATGGADLAIANAGTEYPGDRSEAYYNVDALSRVVEVNLIGVINTLGPFLKEAAESGRPMHLAALGSVAGFRALPNGSYGASKAGVKTLMDTWRLVFTPAGIRFTTICPGYVESEMSDRDPFAPKSQLPNSKAASMIARALDRGKKTYVFPPKYRPVAALLPWIPDAVLRAVFRSKMKS